MKNAQRSSLTNIHRVLQSRRVVVVAAVIIVAGCTGSYDAQYEEAISLGHFLEAKTLAKQQLAAYALRDYNPTLPLRMAEAHYRHAYAHGKLGEYDSMKISLDSGVNLDPTFFNKKQRMLEYFEVEEYNKGVSAYNAGDFEGSLVRLRTAYSIVDGQIPHEKCTALILRVMASASIAAGKQKDALDYYEKASAMGDLLASEKLASAQNGESPEPEPTLKTRPGVTLSGIP